MINFIKIFTISEFFNTTKILALFVLGMTIYSIFIFKFYKYISKRDLFNLNLKGRASTKFFRFILYTLEYLVIFPIMVFAWFSVISSLIILLSKTGAIQDIMLMSMALTAVIRLTAYYEEGLSQDLAKLLPFVLMGVFLVDISFFSLDRVIDTAQSAIGTWKTPLYYLLFVGMLEFVLRISTFITGSAFKEHLTKDEMKEIKIIEKM